MQKVYKLQINMEPNKAEKLLADKNEFLNCQPTNDKSCARHNSIVSFFKFVSFESLTHSFQLEQSNTYWK